MKHFGIFDLSNQVAIITGAARGIGAAITLRLAEFGASTVCVDVDLAGAEQISEKVRSLGQKSLPMRIDISNEDDVSKMVEDTLKTFGKIDILVNNAAILQHGTGVDISVKDWDRVINVNLRGVFLCSKAIIHHMIKRQSGRIINISSWAANTASGVAANYAVSKAGVSCLTKSLARQGAPYGVIVNGIAPHTIATEMTRAHPKEVLDAFAKELPLGRLGEPEEVANVVIFLASKGVSYLTGQIIHVNGGALMEG